MRSYLFLSVYLVFALLVAKQSSQANALNLKWKFRNAVVTDTLENTCQCDCCYNIGSKGRTDCVPPSDTTFEVQECSLCDVEACGTKFRIACSAMVTSTCIVRKGWLLRTVPMVFIIISVFLLFYGLFFKKYDGYHDVASLNTAENQGRQYNAFAGPGIPTAPNSRSSNQPEGGPRRSSTPRLPPIMETEVLPLTPR